MAEHIGQRAGKHAHLAMKGGHPAEVGMLFARRISSSTSLKPPSALRDDIGIGAKGASASDSTTGPSPARRRHAGWRSFVQVDVHRIDAEVARTHLAHDGVEIGAVAIDIAADRMHRVGYRLHVALEQPAGIGIGDHHRRRRRGQAAP